MRTQTFFKPAAATDDYTHPIITVPYEQFSELLESRPPLMPYSDGEDFLRSAERLAEAMPLHLRQSLRSFARYSNDEGFLHLRLENFLPVPPEIPTPTSMKEAFAKKDSRSEFILAVIASLVGSVFSYQQMYDGVFIHNLFPIPTEAAGLSSLSSKVYLDLHTEDAFHPHRPDYLILMCLREDSEKNARSILSSANTAIQQLPYAFIEVLRQPVFRSGVQHNQEVECESPLMPILTGDAEKPFINFDPDLMTAQTTEAQVAMQALKEALDRNRKSFFLQQGDVLILDNRRVLHGRNAFNAKFDGQDRWLQRVYVMDSLKNFQAYYGSSSRIINHCFEDDPTKNITPSLMES